MRNLIYSILLVACVATSIAKAESKGGGGGDRCEDRFKVVTKDLATWIANGGAANLDLTSARVSPNVYAAKMLSQISKARITCVSPGDPGFPVLVNGYPKECRSFFDENGVARIICDRQKFYSGLKDPENDPVQYRIVHHEFATLAGLEAPNSEDSKYELSGQITAFLETQMVKRLVVKPVGNKFLVRKERIQTGAATDAKKELEAYRYVLELAGRKVSKVKITDVNGIGHVMGIDFESRGERSMNCTLAKEDISVPIFGTLKKEMDEFLAVRRLPPSALVDAELTETSITGHIRGVRLTYCEM